jgi:hypothetical protein
MVKFVPIDPDKIPNFRESHRGRVSYPILKSFLETGETLVMLDRTGIQQNLQALNSSLGAYIRSHNLPIKIFNRRGELYLLRLDTDPDGKVTPLDIDNVPRENQPIGRAPEDLRANLESIPVVDDDEVDARFQTERGQVTK